jgi:hypothetical protein
MMPFRPSALTRSAAAGETWRSTKMKRVSLRRRLLAICL